MSKTRLDILLVEDNSVDRTFVTRELEKCRFDYKLYEATTLEEATQLCQGSREFDIVLLDLFLPDSVGTKTLRDMFHISGHVPIIVVSGDDRDEVASEAADLGAQDFVVKNIDAGGAIRKAIAFAVSRQRTTNELRRNVEILSRVASLDPLTGVCNRRAFQEEYAAAWKRFEQNQEEVSCIMIDLDDFSSVNNTYGHMAGDAVLQSVAVTLASKARAKDTVCRYGGEEFCILLPGTSLRDAWRLASRVCLGIEDDRIRVDGRFLSITASIGVSATYPGMPWPGELIEAADRALYRAKETKNCVVTSNELSPLESLLSK